MAVLWTDLIEPDELTGYTRQSLSDYEAQRGTLARFLPNVPVSDVVARFYAGTAGLVSEARYRAFDAEPEVGKAPSSKRVTIDLPALSLEVPVSELAQLRARGASEEAQRNAIFKVADAVARGTADRTERMRGTVLATGKATIAQDNYADEADFGRSASMSVTATTLWSAAGAKQIDDLRLYIDTYRATNGVDPGALVISSRIAAILAASPSFATVLAGGGSRPATQAEVKAVLSGYGVPEVIVYDRRTSGGRVISDDTLLLLPEPVDPNSGAESELGGTFWGQTLTSQDAAYGIADVDQPGIVVGVYRHPKPPMIAEVISDAIALPVLANANLSFAAKVL